MIYIVALATAVKGKESELEVLFKGFVDKTRQEKGCVQYDLHQDTSDPRLFIFFERWESEDDLKAHLQSPHIQAGAAQRGKLYESIEIKSLRPLSSQLHAHRTGDEAF